MMKIITGNFCIRVVFSRRMFVYWIFKRRTSVRLYVKFAPRVETHGRVSKMNMY